MFINQPAKLSQVVTHIALGVAVLFGSLAAPAIGSSPPTYSLIAQESKSPEDLLRWKDGILISQAVITPSEKDAKFDIAIIYYRQGIVISTTNKAKAIKSLETALAIFVDLGDKTNEQKVREALNSLGKLRPTPQCP